MGWPLLEAGEKEGASSCRRGEHRAGEKGPMGAEVKMVRCAEGT